MDDKALEKFIKAPKTVAPRKRHYPRRPVIAIYRDQALTEDGELMSEWELLERFPALPPTLFVRMDAARYVVHLDRRYRGLYPGSWNCRFITKESHLITGAGAFQPPRREQVVCHYFGWKNGNYHKILDPYIILEKKLPAVDGEPYIQTLLRWGTEIRDFCDTQHIEVRVTAGAISSQFLTDPRFYPNARRKVPSKINARVRECLPGNYYSLEVEPRGDREYTAYYLDQHSAHHYHARRLRLPHADELYAYGRFTDCGACVFDRPWDDFFGLYCLDLGVPHDRNVPHWLCDSIDYHVTEGDVLRKRFVYSNELSQLRDNGFTVVGVRAAWGSHKADTGLNRYAAWAYNMLERDNNPPWLKRILLATYGALAITPRDNCSLYARSGKGEPASVRIGSETFTGKKIKGVKLEPRIANVIHRGMIEAACRDESIGYADYLQRHGYHVLSIYSDAVLVEVDDEQPAPMTLDPWRLKRQLTHLRYINSQAYMSAEETKIPGGVGREILQYIQQSQGRAPLLRPKNPRWSENPIGS